MKGLYHVGECGEYKSIEYKQGMCRVCWLIANDERYRNLVNNVKNEPKRIVLPLRRNKCEFLGVRSEFKAGCSGWRCGHDCEKGFPAVPGGYCQSCEHYIDSGEVF